MTLQGICNNLDLLIEATRRELDKKRYDEASRFLDVYFEDCKRYDIKPSRESRTLLRKLKR